MKTLATPRLNLPEFRQTKGRRLTQLAGRDYRLIIQFSSIFPPNKGGLHENMTKAVVVGGQCLV